jgi:hypothetical protein
MTVQRRAFSTLKDAFARVQGVNIINASITRDAARVVSTPTSALASASARGRVRASEACFARAGLRPFHGATAVSFNRHNHNARPGGGSSGGAKPISGTGVDKNILDNLLNSHEIVALAEELEEVGKTKDTMTVSELHEFVRTCKASTSTPQDVASTVKLLEDSGRVLILEDLVYLHPREVTSAVLRVLPGVPSKVFGVSDQELLKLQSEYDEMHANYDQAQRRASTRSSLVVYGGLMVLCAQLATFVRLTYYEFSWDVMEPISYFVGLSNAIMVYLFYIWNRRDFSFETWQRGMEGKYAEKTFRAKGFDIDRYVSLARRLRKAGK